MKLWRDEWTHQTEIEKQDCFRIFICQVNRCVLNNLNRCLVDQSIDRSSSRWNDVVTMKVPVVTVLVAVAVAMKTAINF